MYKHIFPLYTKNAIAPEKYLETASILQEKSNLIFV